MGINTLKIVCSFVIGFYLGYCIFWADAMTKIANDKVHLVRKFKNSQKWDSLFLYNDGHIVEYEK